MSRAAALLAAALLAGPAQAQGGLFEPTLESGIGVWYRPGAPAEPALWREGDPGTRLLLRLLVMDTDAEPLPSAQVELWHADANGEVHADRYRARLLTDRDGAVEVSTVLPGYIWGPRHVHVVVTHPDFRRLVTRVFFQRDPEVDRTGHPDLAIALEDGDVDGEPMLFGEVRLIPVRR